MGYWHKYWSCPFFKWDQKDALGCEAAKVHLPASVQCDYYDAYCANTPGWERCTLAQEMCKSLGEEIRPMRADARRDIEQKLIELEGAANRAKFENGRLEKHIKDLEKEIERLKPLEEAAKQLSALVDSIMAEVTVAYGKWDEDGKVGKLNLPLVSVLRNNRDYKVRMDVEKNNDEYVITVAKREENEVPVNEG